jgi:hypothetical protein
MPSQINFDIECDRDDLPNEKWYLLGAGQKYIPMQIKVREVAEIWEIKTLREFLQHLDVSLDYHCSGDTTWYSRNFWECQGSMEVTAFFLLDICRAFHLKRLSDIIDFDQARRSLPKILENQPHLTIISRLDECVKCAGTSKTALQRQQIVSRRLLRSLEQGAIVSERPFFLSSLDKIAQALQLETIDQLFQVEVVAQPVLKKQPRKAPICKLTGEAYGKLTLSIRTF